MRNFFYKGAITGATMLLSLGLFAVTEASVAQPSADMKGYFGKNYGSESAVNRKNFAGAAGKVLEIAPSKNKKCFSDLSSKDKTTPVICGLARDKIIKGEADKEFNPTARASREFIIITLCKAQNWTKSKTFSSCARFAAQKGIIPQAIAKKSASKKAITYGELLKILKKLDADSSQTGSIENGVANIALPKIETKPVDTGPTKSEVISSSTGGTRISPSEIPSLPPSSVSFTPYGQETVGREFYGHVMLDSSFSNHFFHDEVYFFEGQLTDITADEIFIFLCRANESCSNSTNFLVKTSGNRFKIPVHFKEAGNFQMGIIWGRSGSSRIQNISVLHSATQDNVPANASTQLSTTYDSGKTTFHWNGTGNIARLIIYQGTHRKDYIFRQGTTSHTPDAIDFAEFSKGPAMWLTQHNGQYSMAQPITLTVQEMRTIDSAAVRVKELAEFLKTPARVTFKATALSEISKKAAITLPNGAVKDIVFSNSDVPQGADLNIDIDFQEEGVYIFEVNNPSGGAVINVPVYVGNLVPLLPDFFARNPSKLSAAPLADLADARNQLLDLINRDRLAHGVPAVILWDELSRVAQAHSDNMATANFFAHKNPAGKSPDDRRKGAGISVGVRENLGKATSIAHVHEGLMRSPVHRAAILDSSMRRVGIGMTKNAEGYLLATENFSTNPLLGADLPGLQTELFNHIVNERSNRGLAQVTLDSVLEEVTTMWSGRMATENFFATRDVAGSSLVDAVRARDINTAMRISIVKSSDRSALFTELVKQAGFLDSTNIKVGVGVGLNSLGELYMTTIYTP